jgi:hypothetical protein
VKGDFSRTTFNPSRHYTQLPLQQGRVLNDADWNEQAEIALYDSRGTRRHVIGPSGGSLDRAALRVQIGVFEADKPALVVGGKLPVAPDPEPGEGGRPRYSPPGLYWVDGCTLTQDAAYALDDQPHLKAQLPPTAGFYFAWVETFERLLTALDAPEIREVALGGPDHGTRVQQIWQVRLFRFDSSGANPLCSDVPSDWRPATPTGRLHARAADPNASSDPCAVPQTAGYRRLENQLYRVEIRQGGDENAATFVWSRENGVVRVRALPDTYDSVDGRPVFQVAELGRDELTRLAPEDWVEITDDARTVAGLPGYLCQIAAVSNTTLELHTDSALSADEFNALVSPSVRRWDQVEPRKHPAGAAYLGRAEYDVSAATGAGYFELEDGVQIRFSTGTYRSGDYWLVPARTATADVEFPAAAVPPHGVPRGAAGLAILRRSVDGKWSVVRDCRHLFAPLTKHQYLHYVGGDGQEAMPGKLLGAPLEVAVTNAGQPVEGVPILFEVQVPAGTSDTAAERIPRGYLDDPAQPLPPTAARGRLLLRVATNAKGIASARWVLGTADWSQHVTARVDLADWCAPTGALHFHATQSIAREVFADIGACPTNEADPTLKTVQALMSAAGIDPSNDQHQNVQHVLHQLLCRLHAGHVPYAFPASPSQVDPATVDQVKSALDALYWMLQQRGDCCCFADVIKKLADLVGGKAGEELCKALQQGPVEGDCSLLELTLGIALNLVRTLYAVALAFLDLQDAPGPDRAYQELRLGDETGIELSAFIHGEGPAWFAARVEERLDQVDALGDQLGDVIEHVLEGVLDRRGLAPALRHLAAEYGKEGSAWNGPATRLFILENIWQPLFETPRLDDRVLVRLRELLFEIVTGVWQAFVELLLCGEPIASRIPGTQWLGEIGDDVGRAFERALELHGLVYELPRERWGTARDMHMMASSQRYIDGATWVIAVSDNDGLQRPTLLRWRNQDERGPLQALANERLKENLVLPDPDLEITIDGETWFSAPVLDSGADRDSVYVLVSTNSDAFLVGLWVIPTHFGMEGLLLESQPPQFSQIFSDESWTYQGSVFLMSCGPDHPPTIAGPMRRIEGPADLAVWPPTHRSKAFVVPARELENVGLPDASSDSMHGFMLDEKPETLGRFLALALTRVDRINGVLVQRNVLLLLGGENSDGVEQVPWWGAPRLRPVAAFDMPAGIRVVGGAHDLIALQDEGRYFDPNSGQTINTGDRRWMFINVSELLNNGFPTHSIPWDGVKSIGITQLPEDRWREGDVENVVYGNDGPWVQALGPLSSRLGLYRAYSGTPPLLQRQMVLGVTGDGGLLDLSSDDEDDDTGDGQGVGSFVLVRHDYLLQVDEGGPRRHLLTASIRDDGDTPVLEFHASPRS